MVFYTVEIKSQPRIAFAHSIYEKMSDHSRNIIDHRRNMIEISSCGNCAVTIETDNRIYECSENSITVFMPDKKYLIRPILSQSIQPTCLQAVAIYVDNMIYERHECVNAYEASEIINGLGDSVFILPEKFEAGEDGIEAVYKNFHSMISSYLLKTAFGNLMFLSEWYKLCAFIDSGFRRQVTGMLSCVEIEQNPKTSFYYVYKIKKYIRSHLSEPIGVVDAAEMLERSANYIGRIFKKECGISISEYISRERVMRLREIICFDRNTPISELVSSVGFTDQRYAQRLFKRYTGITMHRCRQISGGLSLYFNDPWRNEALEHDTYFSEEEAKADDL